MDASSKPTTPPKSPDQNWAADAIVVERLHSVGDDNPEEYAKSRLRNACNDVTLDAIEDKFVFGNRKGFRILEELTDLRRNVERHEHRHMVSEGRLAVSERRLAISQQETVRLRLEMEGKWFKEEAFSIRRRFLDCFKRDVLGLPEFQHTKAIKAGNMIAHHGNAVSDAYLFKHDNRMDLQTYSQLYGFQHTQVLKYFEEGIEGGIFSVLNAHATLLAQSVEGKESSSEYERAFRSFITIAENSYPLTPMDDDKSQLARAYWEFWRLHKQESS